MNNIANSFILYTDGGARGNPGPAAAGVVLRSVIKPSHKVSSKSGSTPGGESERRRSERFIKRYLGEMTNNVAEYTAVIMGLEEAVKLRAEEVELRLDSELVGKQLIGEYKVKDKNLQSLFVKAWNLKVNLKKFTVTIIPREENQVADRLVNEVLDEESRNT